MQTNSFGFTISRTTNILVVAEATTNLANPMRGPVQTNTLLDGATYFADLQWTNYPGRIYRLRAL